MGWLKILMLSCVKPNSHVKSLNFSWAFSMRVLRYLLLWCQDELSPRLLLPADDRRCLCGHRGSGQWWLHCRSWGVLQLHQSLESAGLGFQLGHCKVQLCSASSSIVDNNNTFHPSKNYHNSKNIRGNYGPQRRSRDFNSRKGNNF